MENKYFLPVAVVLAGLFIGGAVIWNGSHPPTGGAGGTPSTVNIKDVKTDGMPFIGKADAPVTVAFWSDFQCPFCKSFEQNTLPQIIKDYVDTGKAKVVFFDFAFLGGDSIAAAAYNLSVWKLYPEQYFAWRTAMYMAQDDEGDNGFGDAASIDKLNATVAGLDAAKISADVKANMSAYKTTMDAERAEGQKFGVNATPSFVIGTHMIAGAVPYNQFQAALDPLVK